MSPTFVPVEDLINVNLGEVVNVLRTNRLAYAFFSLPFTQLTKVVDFASIGKVLPMNLTFKLSLLEGVFTLPPSDPRVKEWWFVSLPLPALILLFYLLVVLFGPRLISKWKPFTLRRFLVAYNSFLVVLNAYIFSLLCTSAIALKYSLLCQHIVYSYDELELRLASGLWWYYVSKLIELTDTFIFILRKKLQQLTFLHVYHHMTMPFWCWMGVRWFCGGSTFFIPTINSFVHIVMYTYYGLSALRPKSTRYLPHKQLLTVLQLVQFFVCMLFGLTLLLVRCDFIPVKLVYVGLMYGASIIGLFINFYISAYCGKHKKTERPRGQLHTHTD